MEKTRVLHFGLTSNLGGIETYLLKLASQIDKDRFLFEFLVYGKEKPCFYDDLKNSCEFHFVPGRRESFMGNRNGIKNLIQKDHFDIVHCHLNSLSDVSVCKIAKRAGCKVIIHSRNAGITNRLSDRVLHTLHKNMLSWNDYTLLAVSDYAGKWMFGDKKFRVINNGVDAERFKYDLQKREEMRRKLNIDRKREVIVHVGSFSRQKNHMFLLKVFNYYIEHYNRYALLLLVGAGKLEKMIRAYIIEKGLEGSIILLGNRKDIPDILSAADKFIFPSFYEGFPNALLEAEAAGLPCLISDTITRQVMIPQLCTAKSLSEDVGSWSWQLANISNGDRKNGTYLINELGLGIKHEIREIETLYIDLLQKGKK